MLKWMESHVKSGIGLLVALSAIGCACNFLVFVKALPPDNMLEECIEEVIKENLGVEIDLTPDSPE